MPRLRALGGAGQGRGRARALSAGPWEPGRCVSSHDGPPSRQGGSQAGDLPIALVTSVRATVNVQRAPGRRPRALVEREPEEELRP